MRWPWAATDRPGLAKGQTAPSSGPQTEAQVAVLSSVLPPFPPPSLFDMARFVDDQAEDLKELCEQLHVAFDACAQDVDPRLDDEEMFDPIAARFLWHHVPDIRDIASRASVLGFWLQVLRGVVDVEKRQSASLPEQALAAPPIAGGSGSVRGRGIGMDNLDDGTGSPRHDAFGTVAETGDLAQAGSEPDGEDDLPPFLTAQEAAEQLRVSRWAVYDAVKAGTLPAVRVGRAIRIPRHAVASTPADPAVEEE